MRKAKFACLVSTVLLVCTFAVAQTTSSDADAEKAKKKKELEERIVQMLDQTIGEIASLRLAENRAIVYAMSGDLYWKFDSKRSRELFKNAAGEIITLNAENEREKLENSGFVEMTGPNNPRMEILQLVGLRDPELALELMFQTRPAEIAEAMAKAATPDLRPDGTVIFDRDTARATQEIMAEQQFMMRAAASDPDRAAKLLKEMLAKGISFNAVSLLQQINQKNDKLASELAGDVVRKIADTDLTKSTNDLNGAVSFLQFAARPAPAANPKVKVFAFTEVQAKEIANKLAATFLQPAPSPTLLSALNRAMPSLEKLVPEKIVLLKQRQAQLKKTPAAGPKNARGQARPFDPTGTPEQILAAAAKLADPRDRTSAYQAAAAKIGQIADEARAKRLIDQIPDERIRSGAIEQFEAARASRLLSAGNLDEARRQIGTLTNRRSQIQRLVTLATLYHRKGGEKALESANSLMSEAKAMTNPFPEDEDELADLMEVVKGYAAIEPDTAFRLVEPLMDQFNEIVQATAVLSKYNKRDRSFKKGEMVMRMNGGPGGLIVFRYVQQMQLLGKADLERISLLVDRFQRSDTRTIMRLYVLQGYLRGTPG